jgi:hypothetical protein
LTATGTQGEANAEPNMLFDSTNFYLSSYSGSSVNGDVNLITVSQSSGNSAFFDYYVSNEATERAGTVIAVWNGGRVTFTDYSSPDTNGSTAGITFNVTVGSGNAVLAASVTTGGPWTVKVGSRVIF